MTEINHSFNSGAIVLDRYEVYDMQVENVWPYKRVNDIVEGIELSLSNMTTRYPFEVNGQLWRSSEDLYLCGEFSDDTESHLTIQNALRDARSPFVAKRFVKAKHRSEIRADFADFRTQWMVWIVWQKCKGNAEFRAKLLSIPDGVTLVEDTTTDHSGSGMIWGAINHELNKARKEHSTTIIREHKDLSRKAKDQLVNIGCNSIRNVGAFRGQNNMGKILMICRECIKCGSQPVIDLELLRSKNIFILGQRLTFRD